MSDSDTLTVKLSPGAMKRLTQLARKADRSEAHLAGEAIEAFVARELEIVGAIRRGLADAQAGRVIPHADAMARIAATIERAAAKRR